MNNQPHQILKSTSSKASLGTSTVIFDPSPPRTPIPEMLERFGVRRCPTLYLHNTETDTYHPISFEPYMNPGDPGSAEYPQVLWKSICHHSEGFSGLPAARDFVLDHPNCMEIGEVQEWDGTNENAAQFLRLPESIYAQSVSGDYQPS